MEETHRSLADRDEFTARVSPVRRALHVHCYRMLGSFHDAEEATQETLLRAWRSRHTYDDDAPLRPWLYRIATTTCLTMIEARARRPAPVGPSDEVAYLQPYPDRLLTELRDGDDPAAAAERRESVSLAFVAAMQALPARQRAVLILREVLAWSAAEVASLLDMTVPAVNSALQRARDTMPTDRRRVLSAEETATVRRFIEAWERRDIAGIARLLRDDAVLSMPPELAVIVGREAIALFFATVPADGRLEEILLSPTRANGQPAVAAYLHGEAYGIMVFSVADGGIDRIVGFPGGFLYEAFDLPGRLP